jgi:hypothetical protein
MKKPKKKKKVDWRKVPVMVDLKAGSSLFLEGPIKIHGRIKVLEGGRVTFTDNSTARLAKKGEEV